MFKSIILTPPLAHQHIHLKPQWLYMHWYALSCVMVSVWSRFDFITVKLTASACGDEWGAGYEAEDCAALALTDWITIRITLQPGNMYKECSLLTLCCDITTKDKCNHKQGVIQDHTRHLEAHRDSHVKRLEGIYSQSRNSLKRHIHSFHKLAIFLSGLFSSLSSFRFCRNYT